MKINGVELSKNFIFSGGEVQIQLPDFPYEDGAYITVDAKLTNSDEVMKLMLVSEALNHYFSKAYKILNIPYFPFARQDRRCDDKEAEKLYNVKGEEQVDFSREESSQHAERMENKAQNAPENAGQSRCNFIGFAGDCLHKRLFLAWLPQMR